MDFKTKRGIFLKDIYEKDLKQINEDIDGLEGNIKNMSNIQGVFQAIALGVAFQKDLWIRQLEQRKKLKKLYETALTQPLDYFISFQSKYDSFGYDNKRNIYSNILLKYISYKKAQGFKPSLPNIFDDFPSIITDIYSLDELEKDFNHTWSHVKRYSPQFTIIEKELFEYALKKLNETSTKLSKDELKNILHGHMITLSHIANKYIPDPDEHMEKYKETDYPSLYYSIIFDIKEILKTF